MSLDIIRYVFIVFVVATSIMLLPLSLHGKMTVLSDNELFEITGQFVTIQVEHRNSPYDTSEYYSHDVITMLFDMKVSLQIDNRTLSLGYYTDSDGDTGWDEELNKVRWGTDGPGDTVTLDGIRFEVAFQDPSHDIVTDPNDLYNHMASADRKLLFVKVGTDHFNGSLYFDDGIDRISADVDAHLAFLTIPLNGHRIVLADLIGNLLSGLTVNDSDFYLAISQTGLKQCPPDAASSFESIPGNGIWLHISDADVHLL
ncbi:MAG: hypothetical protein SWO11_04805 [Thermodesulfobacteriota bacterium]|nr:hypothetical protein [Thermodesulfobacteriota bacterium]